MAKEIKGLTVEFVSYVKRGANKKTFFLSKSRDVDETKMNFQANIKPLIKKDDAKQLIYGIVYEPMVEDAHGHFMTVEEIEKACHKFTADYRNIDEEHNCIPGAGIVVENYVSLVDMEINGEQIKKGSWILVTKATDEIWEDVKNGEYTGYSLYGYAEELNDSELITSKKNLFTKLFNLFKKDGVRKDFDTAMENKKNNDIYEPTYTLFDEILDIWWKEDDVDVMKSEIKKSLDQYYQHIESMTFIRKSNDNNDLNINKGEDMALTEETKAEIVELIKSTIAESTKPVETDDGDKPEIEKTDDVVTDDGDKEELNLEEVTKSITTSITENISKSINDAISPLKERLDALENDNLNSDANETDGDQIKKSYPKAKMV